MGILEPGQELSDRVEPTFQHDAQDTPKSAHLTARDVVTFVGFQARVEDALHRRMGLQIPGNTQRALVLLADAQVQGLHAAQQQVGGHWVQRRPVDLSVMINLVHQISRPAQHPPSASA